MRYSAASAFLAGALFVASAGAHDCRVGDKDVNPDDGSTYAGMTGVMVCRDENGAVKSEQRIEDGEFIGLDRRRDLLGNLVERHIDANGNSHGEYKSFWPDGTPKEIATYYGGEVVGVSRSFHKNGKLRRVSYSEEGKLLASIEYDASGALTDFRCGERSYLEADEALCGFGGKAVTTSLYRDGHESARVTFRDGKPVESQDLGDDGVVTASRRMEGEAEVRRTAFPDGRPQSESRVIDGYIVGERTWYMNGKLRSDVVRGPGERDSHETKREFRDDGTLERETQSVDRRVIYLAQYDKAGVLEEAKDFDDEGHLTRKRRYSADGRVTTDERFYPDGSRRSD